MKVLEEKEKVTQMQQQIEEFNDIVEQTFYLEQKVFEWTKRVEDNKKRISKHLGNKGKQNIRIYDDLAFDIIKDVDTDIKFYPDQLKKNLDKEVYNRMVKKTVVVNDLDGLVKLLKANGIKPKQFKQYITTNDEIDVEAIDDMLDIGDIELADLQGCYNVKFSEEIKVRKTK